MKNYSLFLLMVIQFLCLSVFAAELKSGYEVYTHPQIQELPNTRSNLSADEKGIIKGMIHSTAMLFELYGQNSDFYFLARDAEYMYDIAKLLAEENGIKPEQLHLINVSTALSSDPLLKTFLEQQGMSEESLSKGQRAVFVETGFMGSVPDLIMKLYPQNLQKQFEVVLLHSDNKRFPSVQSFRKYGDAEDLERFSHFTKTGYRFLEIEGKLKAVSTLAPREQKESALKLLSSIKTYVESEAGKKDFANAATAWKAINSGEELNSNSKLTNLILEDFENFTREEESLEKFDNNLRFTKGSALKFYQNHLKLGNWSKISNKFSDIFSEVKVKKVVQNLSIEVSKRNYQSSEDLEKLIHKTVDKLRYDDYELLEILVTSYLSYLLEDKDEKLINKLIKNSIKFEAEEALEKLVWVIGSFEDKEVARFETSLINIVKELRTYDKPSLLLKLMFKNILIPERINLMPKLYNALLTELNNEKFKKFQKDLISIWEEERHKFIDGESADFENILKNKNKFFKSHIQIGLANKCVEFFL